MNYPAHLLPRPIFKFIDCNVSDRFLIRFTQTKDISRLLNPDSKELTDEAIGAPGWRELPDLSTSILGVFQIDDIYIKILNNDFNVECNPDESVPIPTHPDDFSNLLHRGYWFVRIDKINNVREKYKFTTDPDPEIRYATCKVVHTPMRWNFWHYSIRWLLETENIFWHEIDRQVREKENWSKKQLSHTVRSLIRKHASLEIPNIEEFDPNCYVS